MDDLLIFALIITVAGAALLMYSLRGNPKKNPQPTVEKASGVLEVPTTFLHTLYMHNLESAHRLLKALNDKGIEATIYSKGDVVKVQFTSEKPLKNAEELKRKGLIKDYEITEVICG